MTKTYRLTTLINVVGLPWQESWKFFYSGVLSSQVKAKQFYIRGVLKAEFSHTFNFQFDSIGRIIVCDKPLNKISQE